MKRSVKRLLQLSLDYDGISGDGEKQTDSGYI